MLRQVLLRNALRRLSAMTKPTSHEISFTPAVCSQPIVVRSYHSEEAELREERRKCLEGHNHSPLKDVPNWSEKLASDSEAIVKSERSNVGNFETMQRESVDFLLNKSTSSEPTIRFGVTHFSLVGPREESLADIIPIYGVEEIQIADSKYE